MLYRALIRLARSRGIRKQIATAERNDAFSRWLEESDQQVRLIVDAVLQNHPDDPIGGLINLLRGSDETIRPSVVEVLILFGQQAEYTQDLPAILESLREAAALPTLEGEDEWGRPIDRRAALRAAVAQGLGQLPNPSSTPTLITLLTHERSAVRRNTAWALGRIADPAVIPHLAQVLDDTDPDVRGAAMDALTYINTPDSVSALSEWKQHQASGG